MAEDLGERTEQPTSKRLTDARQRGQVARSQDLAAALELLVAALFLAAAGGGGVIVLTQLVRRSLSGDTPGDMLDVDAAGPVLAWTATQVAIVLVPLLGVMFLAAVLAAVVQFGWLFTTHPLVPRLDRLNPLTGFRRLFGVRNTVRSGVNIVKLVLVSVVAGMVLMRRLPELAALPALDGLKAMLATGLAAAELVAWLLAVFLAIGLADFAYQRWQHHRDLRMTRQEVRDERRAVEGDPDVRARRLRMARQIALQRIRHAVPRAHVVVVNPTHVAVALRYDAERMRAPRVVAKGADELAWRIREVAVAAGVPVVQRPLLARALYVGVEVGQEIAPQFYEAVAEVLAFVYRLRGQAA